MIRSLDLSCDHVCLNTAIIEKTEIYKKKKCNYNYNGLKYWIEWWVFLDAYSAEDGKTHEKHRVYVLIF